MGVGGMRLIALNDIARAAGIDWKYVPFAGAAPSTVALLGGHIDFRVSTPGEAIAMIRAGKTRGLAVSSEKRMKALPDVPTFKELGIGESLTLSRSFWGPPNLPPKIVNIITKAMEKANKDPDFVKLAEDRLLVEVEYRSPSRLKEEFTLYDKKYGPKLLEAFK
jgi:tripartite-type tricarboxylate transporter receptor subunit TctC